MELPALQVVTALDSLPVLPPHHASARRAQAVGQGGERQAAQGQEDQASSEAEEDFTALEVDWEINGQCCRLHR